MGVGRAVQRWGRARVLAWPLLTAKDLAPSTESSRLGHPIDEQLVAVVGVRVAAEGSEGCALNE